MGNSSSKDKSVDSLPAFTKSDTQGSSRSFKSIRNSVLKKDKEKDRDRDTSDAVSIPESAKATVVHDDEDIVSSLPPPSPTQKHFTGAHQVTDGRREVSNTSDSAPVSRPPVAAIPLTPIINTAMKKTPALDNIVSIPDISSIPMTPTSPMLPMSPGMYPSMRNVDTDDMIQRLLDAGYTGKATKNVVLKNAEIVAICTAVREVFLSQPTLLELSAPVKIVGDIHGQYTDLLRLFEMCGYPPTSNYLFLGDYVDRGKQSLETILLLMLYKLKYPENFFLLRGNHECANVTRVYGFYDECKRRCNIKVWKTFIDTFNTLPIAAIVANKIFCVHGGLSPSLSSMDEIKAITRPTDVPDYGLLNDLLWSDPADTINDWEDNERGVSYCFGKNVIHQFLAKHDFDLVCRAHMVVEDGYEFFNDRTLVTVFSAPNYCGEFDNFGSIISFHSIADIQVP